MKIVDKKYISNVVANVIGVVSLSILTLVATPLLLKAMGTEVFALYRTALVSIVSFSFLLDLGLSGAVKRAMGDSLNRNDVQGAHRTLSLAFVAYTCVIIISMILIVILIPWLPDFLNVSQNLRNGFQFLLASVAVYVAGLFLQSIPNGIFVVLGRFDIMQFISVLSKYLHIILILIFISKDGYPLEKIAIITILVALMSLILSFYYLKRLWPQFGFDFKGVTWNEAKKFTSMTGYGLAIAIGPVIIYYGQEIIVMSAFGANHLAIYATAAILSTQIKTIMNAITSPLFTRASQLYAGDDIIGMKYLLEVSIKRSLIVWITVSVPMIGFAEELIAAWMGQEFLSSVIIFKILMVGSFGIVLYLVAYQILNSMGQLRNVAKHSILMIIISLLLSFVSVKFSNLELTGIALSVSMPLIIRGFFTFRYVNKLTHSFNLFSSLNLFLRCCTLFWLMVLTIIYFKNRIGGFNVFELLVCIVFTSLITLFLSLLVLADKNDIKITLKYLKQIFSSKTN
jgi:O-antigen/teichoic acid export membrane protein